jgi:hypothetical protein
VSNATQTEELDIDDSSITQSIDNIADSILSEATESATGLHDESFDTGLVDSGPEEILREMDRDMMADGEGLRQRRTDGEPGTSKSIRIKLKYLNDDLKLVEGDLSEVIGDFKK